MEEKSAHEESGISIELENMGTVNKNMVSIKKGNKEVKLYFSYKTIVGVRDFTNGYENGEVIVSQNNWSTTTGKLLNELEPNKKARVNHAEVLAEAQKRLKAVLYGK